MTQTEVSTQHKILEVVESIQLRLDSIENQMDSFATKDDLQNEIKKVEGYVDHVADKIFKRLDIAELNIRTDMQAMVAKAVGEVQINTSYEIGRLESLIMNVHNDLKLEITASHTLTQA